MAQKDTIIYVGDPMCSWCYGFAPEISAVKDHFNDNKEFVVLLGGLRPYNTETNADLGEFLGEHWKQVEQRTGQPFNYDILQDDKFVYDTEPATRAVWVVRQLEPTKEFDFFKGVQTLFYVQNKDPRNVFSYQDLCAEMGISYPEFEKLFNSDEAKVGVKQDFQLSASLGVRGFPSVLYIKQGKYYLVTNGFTTSKDLIKTIEGIKR